MAEYGKYDFDLKAASSLSTNGRASVSGNSELAAFHKWNGFKPFCKKSSSSSLSRDLS